MFFKSLAFLLAAGLIISLSACAEKNDVMKRVKDRGQIVVGTSADYPPYEFHKSINGVDTIVGFDIDIAREIAKDLGVELKIIDMDFGGLLAALNANTVDFVIAGMTPDEERKKAVDFSIIYYEAEQAVLIRAEDKNNIKTLADLKGKRVGAQQGSIQEEIAKEQISGANVLSLAKVPDLILELKTKKVDALVMERPVAKNYVKTNPELFITDIKVEDDEGGSAVAVKKNNPELVKAINKTLDRLMKDGKIDEFFAKAVELSEE